MKKKKSSEKDYVLFSEDVEVLIETTKDNPWSVGCNRTIVHVFGENWKINIREGVCQMISNRSAKEYVFSLDWLASNCDIYWCENDLNLQKRSVEINK